MKERPILFNGEMVRAILDGRKTMTRRVVKGAGHSSVTRMLAPWRANGTIRTKEMCGHEAGPFHDCPYGAPGDRLWVRETWMPESEEGIRTGGVLYRATDRAEPDGDCPFRWRPSIHMPRLASRITLEITDVRVEKVRDITHADALAEGVAYDVSKADGAPVPRFRALWDSIYAKRGYGWNANPWAWVIEFKRVEGAAE